MIQVSLTNLILLSMCACVALLTLFWLFAVVRERLFEKRARHDLIHCRICGSIFENTAKQQVMHCPACGSQNEAVRPSPI